MIVLILVEENYLSYIVLTNKKTVFMIDIKNAPDCIGLNSV